MREEVATVDSWPNRESGDISDLMFDDKIIEKLIDSCGVEVVR